MGTVLAMRKWLALAALLSACGPLANENPLSGIGQAVRGAIAGGGDEAAAPADPRQALTREAIEQLPTDLILVAVPSRGAIAGLLRSGNNGNRTTWISPDGISVTTEAGLVVATRGFGFDVMAADVSGLRAVLDGAASGRYVLETLNGRDQVVREVFDCTPGTRTAEAITIVERTYQTTKLQIICGNSERRFGSNFWIDRSGTVWKSQQFTTAELGFLNVERL